MTARYDGDGIRAVAKTAASASARRAATDKRMTAPTAATFDRRAARGGAVVIDPLAMNEMAVGVGATERSNQLAALTRGRKKCQDEISTGRAPPGGTSTVALGDPERAPQERIQWSRSGTKA